MLQTQFFREEVKFYRFRSVILAFLHFSLTEWSSVDTLHWLRRVSEEVGVFSLELTAYLSEKKHFYLLGAAANVISFICSLNTR